MPTSLLAPVAPVLLALAAAATAPSGPTVATSTTAATIAPSAPEPTTGARGSRGAAPAEPTAGGPCPRPGGPRAGRPAGAPTPYLCPVPGPFASPFDGPATRWSAGHRGVDMLTAVGAVVRSPGAGRVTFAGMVAGRPVVTVDHGGGWRTSLEPVRATAAVGSTVRAGQPLGTLDPAPGHCAPAACLHLGVRRGEGGDGYVDPELLLGVARVVLLPLGRQ